MDDAGVREDLALASLFGGVCLANSGWAPSTGSPQQPAPDSLRRMCVCAAVLAAAMDVDLRALA